MLGGTDPPETTSLRRQPCWLVLCPCFTREPLQIISVTNRLHFPRAPFSLLVFAPLLSGPSCCAYFVRISRSSETLTTTLQDRCWRNISRFTQNIGLSNEFSSLELFHREVPSSQFLIYILQKYEKSDIYNICVYSSLCIATDVVIEYKDLLLSLQHVKCDCTTVTFSLCNRVNKAQIKVSE